jgi:hypothetical protein
MGQASVCRPAVANRFVPLRLTQALIAALHACALPRPRLLR